MWSVQYKLISLYLCQYIWTIYAFLFSHFILHILKYLSSFHLNLFSAPCVCSYITLVLCIRVIIFHTYFDKIHISTIFFSHNVLSLKCCPQPTLEGNQTQYFLTKFFISQVLSVTNTGGNRAQYFFTKFFISQVLSATNTGGPTIKIFTKFPFSVLLASNIWKASKQSIFLQTFPNSIFFFLTYSSHPLKQIEGVGGNNITMHNYHLIIYVNTLCKIARVNINI